ncbi:MAG: hypothetical protein LBI36_00115 [Oscillospiraceae bacterium]|nr:hypothetical protein [Oscillospiraceae bacterium]
MKKTTFCILIGICVCLINTGFLVFRITELFLPTAEDIIKTSLIHVFIMLIGTELIISGAVVIPKIFGKEDNSTVLPKSQQAQSEFQDDNFVDFK